MDPRRVVDVRGWTSAGKLGLGSGYLIAPRLVLTARHVTRQRFSGVQWPNFAVYVGHPKFGYPESRSASVRWVHPTGQDVALLELDHGVEIPHQVRWGRAGGRFKLPYYGLAFPRATRTDDEHRKVEHLHGSLSPLGGGRGVHDLYDLNQDIAPAPRTDGKEAWGGASGAAVFCDDRLVGVVIHDDKAFANHRLRACPVYTFNTDGEFIEILREHNVPLAVLTVIQADSGPSVTPGLRLPSWLEPLPTEPADVFVGREEELRQARSQVGPRRIISVVGPEHTGKSAFIRQLTCDNDFRRRLGETRPWALLEINVPGCGSRFPISRELARKLDVTLFTFEEYGEDTTSTQRKTKHILSALTSSALGHDMVTVIDCARFGKNTRDLEADLDEVLSNPAFQRSVVLIASTTPLCADGSEQLRKMPNIQLGPLTRQAAADLLSCALDSHEVRVDTGQAIDEANDTLIRRPGILLNGVDQHASRYVGPGPHNAKPVAVALDLLDACRMTITQVFEEADCRLLTDSGDPGPLAALAIWAMVESFPLPGEVLIRAGISQASLQQLAVNSALLNRPPPADQSGQPWYELGRATREALRHMTLVALGLGEGRRLRPREAAVLGAAAHDSQLLDKLLESGAHEIFDASRSAFDDDDGNELRSLQFAVECTSGWLRAHTDGLLPRVDRKVQAIANALDTESYLLPVDPSGQLEEEPTQRITATTRPNDGYEVLYQAVSTLNVRMREPVTEHAEKQFVAASKQVVAALCDCTPELSPKLLRSIDSALFFGGHRFECDADMLRIRASAVRVLSEDAPRMAKGRVSRLASTVSWLLNTADLQLDGADPSEGRFTVDLAHQLMELLPPPNTIGGEATQLGLRIRAARAKARTVDNEPKRLESLREALELSRMGLERFASTTVGLRHLWTRRFLDAARRCALEVRTDEERSLVVDSVFASLVVSYGPMTDWELPVRLPVARFLRNIHRHQADPALRLEGANTAVELLLPYKDTLVQQGKAGNPSGLLEFAQTTGFRAWALAENELQDAAVAEAKSAERCAGQAMGSEPNARAYRVWVESLRNRVRIEGGDPADSSKWADLRLAVSKVEKWLSTQETRTREHSTLALLRIVEQWYLQGRSLRRSATETNHGASGIALDLLAREYAKRARSLEGHEKRYGPRIDTVVQRFKLEREYQHLLAMHQSKSDRTRRTVDTGPAWTILERAERLWPHSNQVRLARAEFHRDLWEHTEAAAVLQAVIRSTRSGQERRQAQLDMATVMLSYVHYGSPNPSERAMALEQVAAQLDEPLGHRFQPLRVAVLRERVRLESGEGVDWERIDEAFDELIGHDYATNIGRYLHSRRYAARESNSEGRATRPDNEPQQLTQLLYENFTDIDLINGLGQLYLRQAELRGIENTKDARREAAVAAGRAYDCFDACRALHEGLHGDEDLVNCFHRAETIRVAAELAESANPLPWKPESQSSWLKLADKLFESAVRRSVNPFHSLCVRRIKETRHLLKRLIG